MLAVLYEDADLLVVNKPTGLVCHPTKAGQLSSLVGRARLYLNPSLSANEVGGEGRREVAPGLPPSGFRLQPCLINRLDRETSGVVLIAKNSPTARELGKLWESRAVQKEYLAIVHGHVREDRGLIDAPLGKDEQSRVAIKDCVRPDGTPAQTEYRVERRFIYEGRAGSPLPAARSNPDDGASPPSTLNFQLSTYSLLRVIPLTGRKHQIRLHLAHLGHPIVGDKLYGGDEDLYLALVENRLTNEQRARLILPNQALHACAVRFGWRGRPWEFCCPPEPWFTAFIGDPSSSLPL